MQNKSQRIAVLNLGCKVNHYETEGIRQQFTDEGWTSVPFAEAADVYVINTCTVTAEAARKSRQMVRRAKRRNPDALVVAVGCDAEMEGDKLQADLIIGNRGKSAVASHVIDYLKGHPVRTPEGILAEPDNFEVFEDFGAVVEQSETRATVKIQDGCNNFCTYCAIPYVRGRVRSRAPESVIAEVEDLATRGFKEVVLTGIHVCSYGRDRKTHAGTALLDLADELAEIEGISRIRFGSIEPDSVTEEFARRFAQNPKLCLHLHLSLQSGSEEVLKKMNRRYTAARYAEAVEALRKYSPTIALTTDIIVGFPGETEDAFQESINFCKEIGFNNIHVFRYSVRDGTVAATFKNRVPAPVSEERSNQFLALAAAERARAGRALIGSLQEVLIEQQDGDALTGYTPSYIPVRILPQELSDLTDACGEIVKVEIVDFYDDSAVGRVC